MIWDCWLGIREGVIPVKRPALIVVKELTFRDAAWSGLTRDKLADESKVITSSYYPDGVDGGRCFCFRPDLGMRIVCEQVSHHPPVSAFHVESDLFVFHGSVHPKIKFWGKSVDITPKGLVTLILKRYAWIFICIAYYSVTSLSTRKWANVKMFWAKMKTEYEIAPYSGCQCLSANFKLCIACVDGKLYLWKK